MKYIKLYEVEDWKSTNPVQYISRYDISDVMTEIIDNFRCYEYEGNIEKIEKSHMRVGGWGKDDRGYRIKTAGLLKRSVKASYILEILPEKLDKFERCLKLAEWRFHKFLGMSPYTTLIRHNILAMQIGAIPQTIYELNLEFGDCALED